MSVFKNVEFTEQGRAAFLSFLREAYGAEKAENGLDLAACESEALDSIQSDINEGNNCGQWEIGRFFTASRRPEIFRAYVGQDITVTYIQSDYCERCGYQGGADWLDEGQTCPRCKLVQ